MNDATGRPSATGVPRPVPGPGEAAGRLAGAGPADLLTVARSDAVLSGDLAAPALRTTHDMGAVCRVWTPDGSGFGEAALPWQGMATVAAGRRLAEALARCRHPVRPAPPGERPLPGFAGRVEEGFEEEPCDPAEIRAAWAVVTDTLATLLGDRLHRVLLGHRTLRRVYVDSLGAAAAERVELAWCTVSAKTGGLVLTRTWLGPSPAAMRRALDGRLPEPLSDLLAPEPGGEGCAVSPWATAQLLQVLAGQLTGRDGSLDAPAGGRAGIPGLGAQEGRVGILDHASWGFADRLFDDEGVPARPAVLLAHGRPADGIVDLRGAARTGARPMGHAARPRWDDPVEAWPRCLEFADLPAGRGSGTPLRLLELRGGAVGHDRASGSLRLTGLLAGEDGAIRPVSMTTRSRRSCAASPATRTSDP
ncbi:hypothetical protein Ssi03_68520 [Sphaerisporangium siamense]|uniref:Metalloprotease TldD/E C-terminal domain-containing protein n=1 Tax=Sphaerisporangium siamense TaxID=795645 RepID=A0A7W7D837_9ACTN|nr:metallopeptidase TldD-related protein [Sphaerisporangium siamense]MBB4700608.1 hypothetical protein [Sphaerisporangium siamense]GII88862.1 hypothetical protein Ssi03_68520 [Sphaerisporangium siamense]